MKVSQLIKKMHRRYAGDTKYPAVGTDSYQMYLDIANDLKDEWATDGSNQWNSCWEERTFGATTAGTLAYGLDKDVHDLSDKVYVDATDGRTIEFHVIKEKDRHQRHRCAFLSSANPKVLNFTDLPNEAAGGTIRAGVYFVPKDMNSAASDVPVDDANWVATAGAAELAFSDPSKEDKYPDLTGQANDLYQKMETANASLTGNEAQEVPTSGFIDPGGCI